MNPFQEAKIKETNARYFGMSEAEMVQKAGKALAEKLHNFITSKPLNPSITLRASHLTFICGLGNNGADGLACANELVKKLDRVSIHIYIIGRSQNFKTEEIQEQFYLAEQNEKKYRDKEDIQFVIHRDAFAKDVEKTDVIIEALIGSGIKGKLTKRFGDAVRKISKMQAKKIAVDNPIPGYKPDFVFSLITPKQKNAEVLKINLPKEVDEYIGPGDIKFLHEPGKNDYKRKTGELLVLGGSDLFHGAPIMAIKAASKFIGSVFYYTTPENRQTSETIKKEIQEFIALKDQDLEKYADYANVVLAGPGMEDNLANQAILTYLLNKYTDKVFVLDAYAIAMANPKNNKFNKRGFKNCILTPHRGELRHIFDTTKISALEGKLRRFAMENKCIVALKGSIDLLFNSDGEIRLNKTGNPGMAKGGTGDILAGIIGALACKNGSWEATKAGVFLSGLAGDLASQEFGYNFSATDEIPFLQKAFLWAKDY